MNFIYHLGRYFVFIYKVFSRPERYTIWAKNFTRELKSLGLDSISIVVIVSFFIGAAITIQMAYNISDPMIPDHLIGFTTRDTMFLEFSSTIIALILAGKVGSNTASEIGTMRITEQIDALEIMGVNSAAFLISPKIMAFVLFIPILTIISMFIGIAGGWIATVFTHVIPPHSYAQGLQYAFIPYYIVYSVIKSIVFAFIIVSISAYQGYYVQGGALNVGRASTKAVVYSSILVLLFDLILTQLLLS